MRVFVNYQRPDGVWTGHFVEPGDVIATADASNVRAYEYVADGVASPAISLTTKPKEDDMPQEPEIIRNEEAYQAFVWFLRQMATAKSVVHVNMAAGALLQDLGEEPS